MTLCCTIVRSLSTCICLTWGRKGEPIDGDLQCHTSSLDWQLKHISTEERESKSLHFSAFTLLGHKLCRHKKKSNENISLTEIELEIHRKKSSADAGQFFSASMSLSCIKHFEIHSSSSPRESEKRDIKCNFHSEQWSIARAQIAFEQNSKKKNRVENVYFFGVVQHSRGVFAAWFWHFSYMYENKKNQIIKLSTCLRTLCDWRWEWSQNPGLIILCGDQKWLINPLPVVEFITVNTHNCLKNGFWRSPQINENYSMDTFGQAERERVCGSVGQRRCLLHLLLASCWTIHTMRLSEDVESVKNSLALDSHKLRKTSCS